MRSVESLGKVRPDNLGESSDPLFLEGSFFFAPLPPETMTIAHEKLPGLDRECVLAAVKPMVAAERNPATAQMMIINPLHGGGLTSLFSTHPSTEERVARLMAMAGSVRR